MTTTTLDNTTSNPTASTAPVVTPASDAAAEKPVTKPTAVRVKADAAKAESAPADKVAGDKQEASGKGKLFRWNGKAFEEVVFEENHDRRVPMVEEAFQAAIEIRKQVQARTRMRPDLSVVTSALVMVAAKQGGVVDEVARYGLELYTKQSRKDGE